VWTDSLVSCGGFGRLAWKARADDAREPLRKSRRDAIRELNARLGEARQNLSAWRPKANRSGSPVAIPSTEKKETRRGWVGKRN